MEKNIDEIVQSQKQFYLSGKTKPISFRIEQLKKLKNAVLRSQNEIITAIQEDFGLVEGTYDACARIMFIVDEINYFISNLKKWSQPVKVKTSLSLQPARSYYRYEPLGVTLLIAAWNAPYMVNFLTLAASIGAGNCSIIKPSELAPYSSRLLAKIIASIYDDSYCSIIEGGAEVTQKLLAERFDLICYTGSTRIGKIVYRAATEHLTPVILELGGKSPCIVDESADIPLSAKRICSAKNMNAGQVCTSPDYILVHSEVKQALISEMKKRFKLFYPEGIFQSPDYVRIINTSHFERIVELLGSVDKKNIEYGGNLNRDLLKIEPTIINNVTWDDKIMQEEIFGPLIPIIEYTNLDQVLENIRLREKPLALYVYSRNRRTIRKVLEETSSGSTGVNISILQFMNKYLPFGGVGQSGFGRYRGKAGFESFSNKKAVIEKSRLLETNLLDPPYGTKHRLLKMMMR